MANQTGRGTMNKVGLGLSIAPPTVTKAIVLALVMP